MSSENISWKIIRTGGTVLIGKHRTKSACAVRDTVGGKIRVACVDLNKTLLLSISGVLHGNSETDWKWWHETVPEKLRALHEDGFVVVISSNQGRLTDFNGDEAAEAAPFKRKMESVMKELGIPTTLFVACANDIFRKPRPGVWSILPSETGNPGAEIDLEKSMIIGDAAGREKDHSDSDLNWSRNLGVRFFTPEVFFLDKAPVPLTSHFDPVQVLELSTLNYQAELPSSLDGIQRSITSLVVLIGLPGAGKSIYYHHRLRDLGYERVNEATNGGREQCLNIASGYLTDGRSVVIGKIAKGPISYIEPLTLILQIDDLNIDVESRKIWISLARRHQVSIHALFFTASRDLCLHNDSVRALAGPLMRTDDRPIYPRIYFLNLEKQLSKPQIDEGFETVADIHFTWLGTDEQLEIWKKHWH